MPGDRYYTEMEKKSLFIVMLFWSSTLTGAFPETDGMVENRKNHRIYSLRTKDFISFTRPELFYDPGYPVIDATLFIKTCI